MKQELKVDLNQAKNIECEECKSFYFTHILVSPLLYSFINILYFSCPYTIKYYFLVCYHHHIYLSPTLLFLKTKSSFPLLYIFFNFFNDHLVSGYAIQSNFSKCGKHRELRN